MAHTTPTCQSFCCSPFATFQDPPSSSALPNLSNPIHPIFAPTQFNISPEDYNIIEMSLRLASKFLDLDNVVRYIVIMVDGDLKKDNADGTKTATTFGQIDNWAREEPVSYRPNIGRYARPEHRGVGWGDTKGRMKRRAEEILGMAIEMVKFDVSCLNGVGADTRPLEGVLTREQMPKFPRGCKNLVCIGSGLFGRMKVRKRRAEEESKWDLVDQFHFATLVVHELAHALENIFTGVRKHETFYQDSDLSERGFEMEVAIFGGLLNATWSRRLFESRQGEYCAHSTVPDPAENPVMVLYGWPSRVYLEMYRERRLKMGVRPATQLRSSKVSRVPLSFIDGLFTMAYWEQVKAAGSGSLNVPGKADWAARWSSSWDEIQPWMTKEEAQGGRALNSPKHAH